MSLQHNLTEVIHNLTSDRATERRKSAESLKSFFLTEDGAPKLLNNNYRNGLNPVWNDILLQVYEMILKESEKFKDIESVRGNAQDKVRDSCTFLMQTTIAGSIKGKCYIKWETFSTQCTHIFQVAKLRKYFGSSYLSVLLKYILNEEYYLCYIPPYAWADLLELGIELWSVSDVQKVDTVRLLSKTIEQGTKRCHLIIPLRDNLPNLTKLLICSNASYKYQLQESFLDIVINVIETLAMESRLVVCNFIETIFPVIMSYYSKTSDANKCIKTLLFHALSLSIAVHHPFGRLDSENGSFAVNWTVWKANYTQLRDLVVAEAIFLNKMITGVSRLGFTKMEKDVTDEFLILAADVFYLIFHSYEEEHSAKRIRFEQNVTITSFNDLISCTCSNSYPWLRVLGKYVDKYSASLSLNQLIHMLDVFTPFLLSEEGDGEWVLLLNIIHRIYPRISKNIAIVGKIWNTCLRLLVSNETKTLFNCHTVIQIIIKSDQIDNIGLNALLKLYKDSTIRLSDSSIKTLCAIFGRSAHELANDCLREFMVDWIIRSKITYISAETIAQLLVQLMTIESVSFSTAEVVLDESVILKKIFSMEDNLMLTDFESGLLLDSQMKVPVDDRTIHSAHFTNSYFTLNNTLKERIVAAIADKLHSGYNVNEPKELKEDIVDVAAVAMHLLSLLLEKKLFSSEELIQCKLWYELNQYITFATSENISNYFLHSENIDNKKKIEWVQRLKTFYIPNNINKRIQHTIQVNTNSNLFTMMAVVVNNTCSDDNDLMGDVDEKDGTLRSTCLDFLANFCLLPSVFKNDIFDLILSPNLYDFSNVIHIEEACNVLDMLSNYAADVPIDNILRLLQNICKELYRSSAITQRLLVILKKNLKYIFEADKERLQNNTVIMLSSYLKRCENHFYPPIVLALVFDCIQEIHSLKSNIVENTPLQSSILQGLVSRIHSIRMYAIYVSVNLFKDCDEKMFQKIIEKLMAVFVVDQSNLANEVIRDEGTNRTFIVLQFLSCIAKRSSLWDVASIAIILELTKTKNIDHGLIIKVFSFIVKDMPIQNNHDLLLKNLEYILNHWLDKKLSILDFPFDLLKFTSVDRFLVSCREFIVPLICLKSQNNEDQSVIIKRIASHLKCLDENIYLDCFHTIISSTLPYYLHNKYNLANDVWHPDGKYFLPTKELFTKMNGIMQEQVKPIYEKNIDKLLLTIVKHIYDKEHFKENFGQNCTILKQNGIHYSVSMFNYILEYLNAVLSKNVLKHLCETTPSKIQIVLLDLWKTTDEQLFLQTKLLSFHQFYIFWDSLPCDTSLNHFICRFTCQSFLHIMEKYITNEKYQMVSFVACDGLHKMLTKILPDLADTIRDILKNIVSSLVKIITVSANNVLCDKIIVILTLLLQDMSSAMRREISLLDPLPKRDIFKKLRQSMKKSSERGSLSNAIEIFVAGGASNRYEALVELEILLSDSNENLRCLYSELNNIRGFSEDSDLSVLHKLVDILVEIVHSVGDDKCRQAACRCLGILGPSDLCTLTTRSFGETNLIGELAPSQYLAYKIFEITLPFLDDSSPIVVEATVSAFSILLLFREGQQVFKDFVKENSTSQHLHLAPYLLTKDTFPPVQLLISESKFQENLGSMQVWVPDGEAYESWLKKLVTAILSSFIHDHSFVGQLHKICDLKVEIADKLFPVLLGTLLHCGKQSNFEVIANGLKCFFETNYDQNSSNIIDGIVSVEPVALNAMLNAVEFLRQQKRFYLKSGRKEYQEEMYNPLNLDYLKVAKAASQILQHLRAIMYADLWWWGKRESSIDIADMEQMQKILRKSFTAIGDMDAVYGCGSAHLSNFVERKDHFLSLGAYSDAMLMQDIALSYPDGKDLESMIELRKELARTLQMSGHYHLAYQYMKDISDSSLDDLKYECMWRLGDWSLQFDPSQNVMPKMTKFNKNFSKVIMSACQYQCLKDSLNKNIAIDDSLFEYLLESGRECIAYNLNESGSESCQSIYEAAAKFQYFTEIEDFRKMKQHNSQKCYYDLLEKWRISAILPFNDFKNVEPILAQRSVVLEKMLPPDADLNLRRRVVDLQLEYAELALENGSHQSCLRLVSTAARISGCTLLNRVKLMEGKAAWQNGHREVALHLVKSLISNADTVDRSLYANALRQYGAWMIETRSESTQEILNRYLNKSLQELRSVESSNTRLKVYLDIARFMDKEYRQVETYIKSATFESKIKCMEKMKSTANNLKQVSQSLSKDEQRVMLFNNKKSDLDEREINSTYREKERYLQLAIRYYLLSLANGELDDLCMFRVISLWLDNPDLELEGNEDGILNELLTSVPSMKFLQVLPQIAPRMNIQRSSFNTKLDMIISRCATEHPHHTLPVLLALSNSHKDKSILNESVKKISSGRSKAAQAQSNKNEEPRVVAARTMLNKLSNENGRLAIIIQQMEVMCDAMISLANYKAQDKQPKQTIPKSENLRKLRDLDAIIVPIITLPVDKSLKYSNIISVTSFADTFSLVGGVNVPKRLMCRGSDGIDRPMLLKGEDDLRQDAVMQQVFTIANQLLAVDRNSKRRKLLVRTYKVVVLSRRSGVLEWCIGTEPFGVYLTGLDGASGAHAKYRPQDISSRKARQKMHSLVEARKSNDVKLAVFQEILSQFKPVFHHFFFDNFLAPAVWYERRLAYTHSVATSSMIGYVLGLGDRHVQNILIDKSTAEVIHIDFGIAFDQGRILPTPETVPFRLSQDIIAGFGAAGIEGVFRRSCEKTMQLLRNNQDTLLTILEVLLFDPLYMWSITPAQAYKKQNLEYTATLAAETSISVSSEAERALLSLKAKLEGREFVEGGSGGSCGVGAGVAVRGQVARLIQQATDPNNLSRLFQGWQPYL